MDNLSTSPRNISSVKGGDSITKNRKRTIIISIGVAFIAIAILWIWKQVQLNNLRDESAKEYERLQTEAQHAVIKTHEQHLRVMAKPFAWVVRTEMMRNNISQINQYTNELIQEKNIQSIIIVNDDGKIVSSTNKKWEGKFYSTVGEEADLNNDSTVVRNLKDSVLVMSTPIMGLNSRLGTLMLTYSLTAPTYAAVREQ